MIALDTSVIVRVLTNDDPAQARRAAALIAGNDVFVPTTVLLETEWVLRFAYRLSATSVATTLRKFLSLPTVFVDSPRAIFDAIDLHETGMDFADALHLRLSEETEAFRTFDHELQQRAERLRIRPPVRRV